MLEPNRLNPPQPFRTSPPDPAGGMTARELRVFVSAEDFDATGILSGCDPCASNYWWMPELHTAGPGDLAVATEADAGPARQATRRMTARPHAAA
ncbi:hypothetical protein EBR56_09290 [bacterium]|nr:hypothetical protein [bacterium]